MQDKTCTVPEHPPGQEKDTCTEGERYQHNPQEVREGDTIEEVESLTYLGSILDEHGETDADVKIRVSKGRAGQLSYS
jgi:hypothetical protein